MALSAFYLVHTMVIEKAYKYTNGISFWRCTVFFLKGIWMAFPSFKEFWVGKLAPAWEFIEKL